MDRRSRIASSQRKEALFISFSAVFKHELRRHQHRQRCVNRNREWSLAVGGSSSMDWHIAYPLRIVVLGLHEGTLLAGSDA